MERVNACSECTFGGNDARRLLPHLAGQILYDRMIKNETYKTAQLLDAVAFCATYRDSKYMPYKKSGQRLHLFYAHAKFLFFFCFLFIIVK